MQAIPPPEGVQFRVSPPAELLLPQATQKLDSSNGIYYGCVDASGKFSGYGVFIWNDGSWYAGGWEDGMKSGYGDYISA